MQRVGMLAAAFAAAAVVAGNGNAALPTLQGSVSDPVNISLTFAGKKVSTLKAGKYAIVVRDTAGDHNFHIRGLGVDRLTPTGGTGTWRWTVTLRKGTYRYVCDSHSSFMKGSFIVK